MAPCISGERPGASCSSCRLYYCCCCWACWPTEWAEGMVAPVNWWLCGIFRLLLLSRGTSSNSVLITTRTPLLDTTLAMVGLAKGTCRDREAAACCCCCCCCWLLLELALLLVALLLVLAWLPLPRWFACCDWWVFVWAVRLPDLEQKR